MVEEHFLGERGAFAKAEKLEHLIFFAGQMDALALNFHRFGVEIDRQFAGADNRLSVTFRAAHNRVDASHQLILVEWLGHIIVSAKSKATNLVFNASQARQNENRSLHLGHAECAEHFITAHVRKVKIQKNNVVIV